MLGAVFLCGPASAEEPDYPLDRLGAPYCTEAADLNRATAHWLQRSLERFFVRKQFSDRFERIGIDPIPDLDELRPLTNRHDSAICERIRRALDLDHVGLKIDQELDRTVPEYVVMSYALPSGGYFAYVKFYESGSKNEELGPPAMSRSSGVHFDENLREVGAVGF